MRTWLAAVLLLAGMGVAAAAAPGDIVMANPPKGMPELTFGDQDGRPLTLGDFQGKVVVLDYWATWCAPCRAEFPELDRLQERLAGQGLAVVPVSLDRGGRRSVDKFYDEMHVAHLGKYLDPANANVQALGLRGLPTTLIIDRQGREVARVEGGAAWEGPEIGQLLEALLMSPVAPSQHLLPR